MLFVLWLTDQQEGYGQLLPDQGKAGCYLFSVRVGTLTLYKWAECIASRDAISEGRQVVLTRDQDYRGQMC